MFRSFSLPSLGGPPLCFVPLLFLTLIVFVEFVLLRSMWPHVYVICVCLVFLSVGDLLVNCFVITYMSYRRVNN